MNLELHFLFLLLGYYRSFTSSNLSYTIVYLQIKNAFQMIILRFY